MKKFCYGIANYIYSKDETLTHSDRFLFYFILQAVLYQIVDAIAVLIIGLILGKLWLCLFALLSFAISRQVYNGYHAKTILACGVMSVFFVTLCFVLSSTIIQSTILGYLLGYILSIKSVGVFMSRLEKKIFTKRKRRACEK